MEINDAELTELRRKAHAFDSEQGRLQKTQGELEAERAKRTELEARVAAQQTATPAFDPTKATEIFGDAGAAVLQGALVAPLSQLSQQIGALGKKLEDREAQEAQAHAARLFLDNLGTKLAENNLPGFGSRLTGDLSGAWGKFMEGRPSINRAWREGDVEAVTDAVQTFIHQNKELVTGGFSPQAINGFIPAVKSEYSDDDYLRETAALKKRLDTLAINEDDYDKECKACFAKYMAAQEKVKKVTSAYGLA